MWSAMLTRSRGWPYGMSGSGTGPENTRRLKPGDVGKWVLGTADGGQTTSRMPRKESERWNHLTLCENYRRSFSWNISRGRTIRPKRLVAIPAEDWVLFVIGQTRAHYFAMVAPRRCPLRDKVGHGR
jgi:hypothetical protein